MAQPISLRTRVHTPPSYQSFGVMCKTAFREFTQGFWPLLGIEVLFGLASFFLQYLFFGGTALKVAGDALRAGNASGFSSSTLYTLIRLTDAAYAIVIPAILIILFLEIAHQGALFTFVTQMSVTGVRRIRSSLRFGVRTAWKTAILLVMLFVSVALLNTVVALLARVIFYYTGTINEGATESINRFLLLLFSAFMLVVFLLYSLAGIQIGAMGGTLRSSLQSAIRIFKRAPWELSWRAFMFMVVLYLAYEIAGNIRLSFNTMSLQTVVSFFFIPLSLFFVKQLHNEFAVSRGSGGSPRADD